MDANSGESVRPLTDRERATLDGFLSSDFAGVEELRAGLDPAGSAVVLVRLRIDRASRGSPCCRLAAHHLVTARSGRG